MPTTADLLDRMWLSKFSVPILGLQTIRAGAIDDADANNVTARMTNDETDIVVFSGRAATRVELGTYEVELSSVETQTPGLYTVRWEWSIDTVAQLSESYLQIGQPSPAYDSLSAGLKAIVEMTWTRFADGFDSELGGPHLQAYFQANFGRNRMAQLLQLALNRLNTISQPHQSYTFDSFPLDRYSGVLEFALYIEVLKHLRRSYVEQVDPRNVSVAWLDRRDYLNRWSQVLSDEMAEFAKMQEVYKISSMNLGQPSLLLAGGIFAHFGPMRTPGFMLTRPYHYLRYF
jgi:hypothetical protein